MILILSEEKDLVTANVINWIHYYEKEFIRINDCDYLELLWFKIDNHIVDFEIQVNKSYSFRYSELSSYWLRRSSIKLKVAMNTDATNDLEQTYVEFCNKELSQLNIAVLQLLYKLPGFGKIEENETNKLTNLVYASEAGLKIPETYISKHLMEYTSQSTKKKITKAIYVGGHRSPSTGIELVGGTCEVEVTDVAKLNGIQFPTLIQEYLPKSYELRIFYLEGKTFTTAIISQNDPQTQLDFRQYNYANPNRTVPYILPPIISEQLHTFMRSIDMKCGSIDMVVTPKGDYTFLEVNPLGQFSQVSYPGNFHIEKYIVQHLIKHGKQ